MKESWEIYMNEKRPIYDGYTEYYMTGKDIKNYFRNCYLCFGKHHSQISSYCIDFAKYYPKIKDYVNYRLFINDNFCSIFDINTDKKLYFLGYTKEKPKLAKD